MAIPRTHEQWAAIKPSETDVALSDRFREEQPYIPPPYRLLVLAAASRLHEQERCVERLAKELERYAFSDPRAAARRILGCEPESGEKGGSNG